MYDAAIVTGETATAGPSTRGLHRAPFGKEAHLFDSQSIALRDPSEIPSLVALEGLFHWL